MNEVGNRKNIQKINETKSGFYGKSDKTDRSLSRLIWRQRAF